MSSERVKTGNGGRAAMRLKRFSCLLIAAAALFFSSCRILVEDLLVAPSLTQDQEAILKTMEDALPEGNQLQLKYPIYGEWRVPIQFADLDDDGTDEAIVMYTLRNAGLNVRIAVVGRDGAGGWTLQSELEGPGTDIASITPMGFEAGEGHYLLVEWSSANTASQQFAVYHFSGGELRVGLAEGCSDMISADLDVDGFLEFCYITLAAEGEPFYLKFVDDSAEGLAVRSEIMLNARMVSSLNLLAGQSRLQQRMIFVDENLSGNVHATEVFRVEDGMIYREDAGNDYDMPLLSEREPDALVARTFDAYESGLTILLPSGSPPRETIPSDALWRYWYRIDRERINYAFATYVNAPLNLNIGIPDGWLENVTVSESGEDPRRFLFIRDGSEVLMELKVLTVDESAEGYIGDGFETVHKSIAGAYRYYIRTGCPPADREYILAHFYAIA